MTSKFDNNQCIICGSESNQESIEHIVPKSLGNIHYILSKGLVCRNCNNRFSRFESKVVTSDVFQDEKRRLNINIDDLNEHNGLLRKIDALKFTTKIGYEALYKSRKDLWDILPHQKISTFLLHGSKPMFSPEQINIAAITFHSIPKWLDKWRLRFHHTAVLYGINKDTKMIIQFKFGRITLSSRIM